VRSRLQVFFPHLRGYGEVTFNEQSVGFHFGFECGRSLTEEGGGTVLYLKR
jgi:hypothetical protein